MRGGRLNVAIMISARKLIGEAGHCLGLAQELLRHGHEVQLVVRRGSEVEPRALELGLPVLQLSMDGKTRLLEDLSDLRKLRSALAASPPDIIHCHRGKDHWLAATHLVFSKRPVSLVRTRHVVMPVRNHLFNRWLYLNRTDRIISVSQITAGSFGSMLPLVQHKMRVIYSAVDNERFSPQRRSEAWRQKMGVGPGQPLIGLIGRLQHVKGQRVFLRAAVKILQDFPEARFLIAGKGKDFHYERLRNYAAHLGLGSKVTITGWLENIEGVLASLDVGCVASIGSEGSSRITYEYMASGVPVVATRVGAIPEILDDQTGVLITPGKSQDLAAGVLGILRSPEHADSLRKNALSKICQNHTPDRWISQVLDVYQSAIDEKRGRS